MSRRPYKTDPIDTHHGMTADEVISRAWERLSLIVTTNLPFESWVEIFGCAHDYRAL